MIWLTQCKDDTAGSRHTESVYKNSLINSNKVTYIKICLKVYFLKLVVMVESTFVSLLLLSMLSAKIGKYVCFYFKYVSRKCVITPYNLTAFVRNLKNILWPGHFPLMLLTALKYRWISSSYSDPWLSRILAKKSNCLTKRAYPF